MMRVDQIKKGFRQKQQTISVEEKIRQLYAMQKRYLQVSEAAISSGFKKPSDEFIRARRLMGQ